MKRWLCVAVCLTAMSGCRIAFSRSPKEVFDVLDTLNIDPADRAAYARELSTRNVRVRLFTAPAWNEIEEMKRQENEARGLPVRPLFRIGPNVVLNVDVLNWRTFPQNIRVGPDGKVDLPYIGEIWVEGLTVEEFKQLMRERLSRYVSDPVIVVNVSVSDGAILASRDVRSGRILVFGTFGGSGATAGGIQGSVVDYTGVEDLQQIIAEIGGLGGSTEWTRVVVYRKDADGTVYAILCNMERLFKEADLAQNIRLQGGDLVFLPSHHPYFGVQMRRDISATLGFLGDSIAFDGIVRYWETNSDRIF